MDIKLSRSRYISEPIYPDVSSVEIYYGDLGTTRVTPMKLFREDTDYFQQGTFNVSYDILSGIFSAEKIRESCHELPFSRRFLVTYRCRRPRWADTYVRRDEAPAPVDDPEYEKILMAAKCLEESKLKHEVVGNKVTCKTKKVYDYRESIITTRFLISPTEYYPVEVDPYNASIMLDHERNIQVRQEHLSFTGTITSFKACGWSDLRAASEEIIGSSGVITLDRRKALGIYARVLVQIKKRSQLDDEFHKFVTQGQWLTFEELPPLEDKWVSEDPEVSSQTFQILPEQIPTILGRSPNNKVSAWAIDKASKLTLLNLSNKGMSSDELKDIALLLSAHYVELHERLVSTDIYAYEDKNTDRSFNGTEYGKSAMNLDKSRTLSKLL